MGSFRIQCDTDFIIDEGSIAHQSQPLATISSHVHAEGRRNPGFEESQIDDNLGTRNDKQTCITRLDKETRRAFSSSKNLTSLGGLGKEFVNLLKKSAQA